MSSPSQIVLLSGGLDSVVNLALAVDKGEVLLGLTFDYGQRAADREIAASRNVCAYYSVPHRVVPLPWLEEAASSSSLIRDKGEVPRLRPTDLLDERRTRASARSVWVPNRNGLFINIAAVLAESMKAGLVVTGFNREEGETFPDNSAEFLEAVNGSLAYSTRNRVRAVSYTRDLDKKGIVRTGLRRDVPFQEVWSCYLGREKMCGECESCRRLRRAIAGTEAEKKLGDRFQG